MPIVDLETPDVRAPRDTPKGFFVTPGREDFDIPPLTDVQPMPLPPPEKVKPTEQDINRAALRTENTIASAINSGMFTAPRHVEEGFSSWEKIKGTPDEEHWDRFVDVRNSQHFDIVQRSIQQEREDRTLLDGLPWYQSFPARMMASALDWPTLMPGGAFVRGAKGGFSLMKSGATVGAWTGASAAVQEVGLHATQSLRTPTESAIDISASTLLGGIIGTAGAKLLTHAEWSSAVRNIERQAAEFVPPAVEMPVVPLGAAAIDPDWVRAFHGSPHDFEKFDLGKIGTGEGAQAYGHGLYFAENTAVALDYQKKLGQYRAVVAGEEIPDDGLAFGLTHLIQKNDGDLVAVRDAIKKRIEDDPRLARPGFSTAPESLAKLDDWISRGITKADETSKGRMYEARIRAKPEEFLDWDKPLSEQPASVRAAIDRLGVGERALFDEGQDIFGQPKSVGHAINAAGQLPDRQSSLSQLLAARGIPGIRYLDQGSRYTPTNLPNNPIANEARRFLAEANGDSEAARKLFNESNPVERFGQTERDEVLRVIEAAGRKVTYNYVVFDDKLIDIIGKDGKPVVPDGGPGAAPAALGAAASTGPGIRAFSISGRFGVTPAVARATQAPFPGLRILHSEVPESRELGLNLFENSTYLEGTTPRAAETRRKQWNAGLREGKEAHEEAYQAWRKRTGNDGFINALRDVFNPVSSPRAWFDAEVGKVGRREDMHDVPEVAQAAKAWRAQVADPLKDAAIEVGKLPAGITPKTAASYFSRIPIRRKINAEEGMFKQHVMEWLETSVPRWKSEFDMETAAKSSKLSGDKLREFQIERRVEYDARFGDDQTIQSMLRGTADEIFKKYTGRAGDSVRPEFIEIEARGPLKELTFLIPDGWKSSSGVTLERWLENSAPEVWSRYSRIMSADVELARLDKRMGGEGRADLRDSLAKVREGYEKIRSGETDPKRLDDLRNQETADITDIEAMRDLMRSVYGGAQREDNWARLWRNAKAFQYIQRMGGVVLSSLTEAPRLVMVAGLKPFMETSFAALRDMPAVKMAINEAKLAGNITDVALSHRMASIAEMNDFYGSKSFFEKFMDNMTNVASHSNGIRLWTDLAKSAGSVYSQNRMLNAIDWSKADESQKAFLRFLGIDESMASRIAAKFDEFGETRAGVKVAHTEKWVRTKGTDAEKAFDRETVGAYRDALNKDLDSMVVTKSVADAPLLANTPFGQVLFQFNTFNMASHQKVLLRGMQEGPAKFISGMIALTSLGMMITYLQAVVANRQHKLPSFADNPGWWIGEGLDRAGLVMLPMVLSNSFEKLSGFNPVKSPLRAFDEKSTQSTRMVNRNELSLFGPTAGSIGDVYPLAQIPQQILKGEEIPKSSISAAERQLVPLNSFIPMRLFLRYFVNPPD